MAALQAHFNNILMGFAIPVPQRAQVVENVPDAVVLRDTAHAEIDTVVRSIREPGGTIPNPAVAAAIAAAIAAGQPVANIPPAIRNHGLSFGFHFAKLLK